MISRSEYRPSIEARGLLVVSCRQEPLTQRRREGAAMRRKSLCLRCWWRWPACSSRPGFTPAVKDVVKINMKDCPVTKGDVPFSHKKHSEDYAKQYAKLYAKGCGECHHDDKGQPIEGPEGRQQGPEPASNATRNAARPPRARMRPSSTRSRSSSTTARPSTTTASAATRTSTRSSRPRRPR